MWLQKEHTGILVVIELFCILTLSVSNHGYDIVLQFCKTLSLEETSKGYRQSLLFLTNACASTIISKQKV